MVKQSLSGRSGLRRSSAVLLMAILGACAQEEANEVIGPAAESVVEEKTEALVTTSSVTLQDGVNGYAGTRDTYLRQSSSGSNYGSATTLYADGDDPSWSGRDLSALLHFDVSSIPSDATITSVTLSVYVTDASRTSGYPIYGMNRAWDEGSATWTQATTGSNWQTSGAQGALDRDSTSLGTLVATSVGSKSVALNSNGLAKVQGWVANPASNFGLIIASTSISDKVAFYSSEYRTAARRPRLAITYTTTTPDCVAPECCTSDAACDDGNACTNDSCVEGACAFAAVEACCQSASECADDGDACTSATCVDHVCGQAVIAGCCHADSDCADSDVCTTDTCVGNVCGHAAIAACCNVAVDCNDDDACTSDACVEHACTNLAIAGCCQTNSECSDANPCTADACVDHVCAFSAIAGCCLTNGDCSDGKVCTADACVGNQCTFTPIAGCCSADSECNDSDPCTADSCVASACTHVPIVGGACGCNVDADCQDGKDCTLDQCVAGACSNVEVPPGACGCQSDAACDDGDACTVDVCSAGTCGNTPADCSDGDPLTVDECVAGTCTHTGLGGAITKTFRNGEDSYTGAGDTKIAQNYPTTNYDTATVLVVDGDEPYGGGKDVATLIRWDNLGIPSDAIVSSASITIYIGGGSNSSSTTAYQIYPVTRPWKAATATWQLADQDAAWATEGALGATDREAASIGATPTRKSGSVTIALNATGIAKVQSWVQDPSTNQGIVIANASNSDGLSLYSSEYGTVANRPMLSVTYLGTQTVSDPVPVGAPGNSPRYGFFVYSDSHMDAATNPVFSTALAQMNDLKNVSGAPPIIAAFSLGDHTEDGGDTSWDWQINLTAPYWNAAATSFGGTAPRYIAVPGNHDVFNTTNWYTYWSEHLPGQASLAGSSSSAGVYYSTTYENALFVGLDTNKATNTSTSFSSDAQINHLRTALTSSTAPFKFVLYHMPAFYCGSSGGGANASSVAFLDLAAQNNVDAVFNGHSHVYTRTCRMTKSHVCTGSTAGTVQVEVGTVGATDSRLRSLKTTTQSVTGYDASGVSSSTSYTCSAAGGYQTTLGSNRTFCYVNVRGCWANVNCYRVGNTTPFDSWTINHCP